MELRRWRGRAEPDEVEIGGTWLARRRPAHARSTPRPSCCCSTHAFDVWQVTRVALATDARNERSRRAIERIGARFEGILRHHRPSLVPGEDGPAAGHGAVRHHRRRLAGRRARNLGRARLASPTVARLMEVLVVCAHPHEDSFTHAVTAAARAGFERAGHHVTTLDLYALGFAPAMSPAERRAYHGEQPLLDPMTAAHAALVRRADVLVFVYPTWWSGPPAILKGWLERVLVPGVAFRFDDARQGPPGADQRPADRRHQHVRRAVDVRQAAPGRRPADADPGTADELRRAHADDVARPVLDRHRSATPSGAAFLDRVEHSMAHLHADAAER